VAEEEQAAEETHVAEEAQAPTPPDGLSAYERERLANIERNEEVLRGLGLLDAPLFPPPRIPPKRARAPAAPAPPPTRRRRSSRVAGTDQPNYAAEKVDSFGADADSTLYAGRATGRRRAGAQKDDDDEEDEDEDEDEDEEDEAGLEDTSVYRYLCGSDTAEASSSASSSASASASASTTATVPTSAMSTAVAVAASTLHGWRPSGCGTRAAAHASYGVDALVGTSTPLLACGGQKGLISVYRADGLANAEAQPLTTPLLQWNAHSGKWIGDVQFCSAQAGREARLLSCSNDAT
jgi:hypothetical protein